MNRRTDDQVLDAVAGDFIAEQTNILPQVIVAARREKRVGRNIRITQYAFLSLVVAILVLVASVPQAASAMRRLFGFLPGIGLVDSSTAIRVLAGPVQQERDGITITIEQITALPDRTVIQYRISGIPQSAYPKHLPGSDPSVFQNACVEPLYIRLPDGKALTYTPYNAVSGTANVPEYQSSFTVEPVPASIDDVTLVMPCIDGTEQGGVPGNWEFDLHLTDAAGNAPLLPVSEIPSSVPAQPVTGSEPPSSLPAAKDELAVDTGIHLTLDRVVALPDGDLLYGSVQWDDTAPYSAVTLDTYRLTDAEGRQVPIMQVSPDPSQMPVLSIDSPAPKMVPFAFKVMGPVDQAGPATLTADSLSAALHISGADFVFDAGAAPSEGEQWLLNQDVQAGPYTIRVESVTRLADGYKFTFQNGPEIFCVDIYMPGTNGSPAQCGQDETRVHFDGDVPTGELTVVIATLDVTLSGSWQVTWQPPESAPIEK